MVKMLLAVFTVQLLGMHLIQKDNMSANGGVSLPSIKKNLCLAWNKKLSS